MCKLPPDLQKGKLLLVHLFRRKRDTAAANWPDDLAVFEDPTGRRWRYLISAAVLIAFCSGVFVSWAIPNAFTPVLVTSFNLTSGTPRDIARDIAAQPYLPIVGDPDRGNLTRYLRVRRDGEQMLLVEPFTNEVIRPASEHEKDEVDGCDGCQYVMERFGVPKDHQLMLTFDDGPQSGNTTEILNVLKKYNVKATFFLIGNKVAHDPALVQEELDDGHMIANHTLTHQSDFNSQSDAQNIQELTETDRKIRSTVGYKARVWRLPEGDPEGKPYAVLVGQQLGYIQVDFSLDTNDWKYAGQNVPEPKLDGSGQVVLLHDGGGDRTGTVRLLEDMIVHAKAEGYTFSTIESLVPAEYLPERNLPITTADYVSATGSWLKAVVPDHMLTMLLIYGGMMAVVSLVYIVLAFLQHIRQYRRKWGKHWGTNGHIYPVSVIVPALDEAKVIRRTLDALQLSDHPIMEIIVVNDGSKDNTAAIVGDYILEHPMLPLRLVNQVNKGKAKALNNGIAHAKYPVVVTTDGDTLFLPDTVSKLARHFKDPKVGVVGGHTRVGNRKFSRPLTWWQSTEYLGGICVNRMADASMGTVMVASGCVSAYRKEAVIQAGGVPSGTKAEDADLTISVQRLGYKVVHENQAVAITEAPETMKALMSQRRRWVFGMIQVLWKHKGMMFRPKYGLLGMIIMPYTVLSIGMTFCFTPVLAIAAVGNAATGNWPGLLMFAAFAVIILTLQITMALWMVHEDPKHLLVVPFYPVFYEPVRIYLLYASIYYALRGDGSVYAWNKLMRLGSVSVEAPPERQLAKTNS